MYVFVKRQVSVGEKGMLYKLTYYYFYYYYCCHYYYYYYYFYYYYYYYFCYYYYYYYYSRTLLTSAFSPPLTHHPHPSPEIIFSRPRESCTYVKVWRFS